MSQTYLHCYPEKVTVGRNAPYIVLPSINNCGTTGPVLHTSVRITHPTVLCSSRKLITDVYFLSNMFLLEYNHHQVNFTSLCSFGTIIQIFGNYNSQ
jgi:hypothetical protein